MGLISLNYLVEVDFHWFGLENIKRVKKNTLLNKLLLKAVIKHILNKFGLELIFFNSVELPNNNLQNIVELKI
jgi:hypothetical protein